MQPSKLTLSKFIEDEWLPSVRRKLRDSTVASYESTLLYHVLHEEALGSVPLQQVTPASLNKLYGELEQQRKVDGQERPALSAQTIRYIHTMLRQAFAAAVRWNRLARNPADAADPPKPSTPPMKTWTADELQRFLAHMRGDRLYAAWRFAAMTGARRGEVLGLKWRNLELDAGRATLAEKLIGARQDSTPKTRKGRRNIQLDPETVAALRTHRKRQAEERLALGSAYEKSDLVFCREDGAALGRGRSRGRSTAT